MTMTTMIQSFTNGAATPCTTHPLIDWFAAPDTMSSAAAMQLCASCPVESLCLISAIAHDEPWGVWGGRQFPLCRKGRHTVTEGNSSRRPQRNGSIRVACLTCEKDTRNRQRADKRRERTTA